MALEKCLFYCKENCFLELHTTEYFCFQPWPRYYKTLVEKHRSIDRRLALQPGHFCNTNTMKYFTLIVLLLSFLAVDAFAPLNTARPSFDTCLSVFGGSFKTGRRGKPAPNQEEDLNRTREIIRNHAIKTGTGFDEFEEVAQEASSVAVLEREEEVTPVAEAPSEEAEPPKKRSLFRRIIGKFRN